MANNIIWLVCKDPLNKDTHKEHFQFNTHSNSYCHGVPHGDPDPEVEDGIHPLHPHLVKQPAVKVVLQERKLLANLKNFYQNSVSFVNETIPGTCTPMYGSCECNHILMGTCTYVRIYRALQIACQRLEAQLSSCGECHCGSVSQDLLTAAPNLIKALHNLVRRPQLSSYSLSPLTSNLQSSVPIALEN